LLWVHGGGLISGTAGANDPECSAYARDLKLVVVSVEYRLAPKYPFPAALDDCFETWQWMQQSADKLEINPSRIAISGQSSGGGLTASLAHRIFDEGGIQPAAQALFCPMLDDRTALRHELDIIQHCGTTKAIEPLGHGILVGLRVRSMSHPMLCRQDVRTYPAFRIHGFRLEISSFSMKKLFSTQRDLTKLV
jgi:acetyl esterase/lipase